LRSLACPSSPHGSEDRQDCNHDSGRALCAEAFPRAGEARPGKLPTGVGKRLITGAISGKEPLFTEASPSDSWWLNPMVTTIPMISSWGGGSGFRRVQIKAGAAMWHGIYQVCISRHRDGIGPHTEFEADFIAAYIIPRSHLVCAPGAPGYRTHQRRISSQGMRPRRPYAHYREAWHLLREPDGLTFG
jgi:hypothetical protein